MKTEKNIFLAFILNITFSLLEFVGGTITRSVAIVSDSIHDLGDAISIGVSYFLERKSKQKPDKYYTYGYIRYSVLGGLISTTILLVGSLIVIYNSVLRIINPVNIDSTGMLIFAIFGLMINAISAYFTKDGDSLNQESVNLHMLEDTLGWLVVLIGSLIMKFTNLTVIDPLMSIGVSIFILIHAYNNFKQIVFLFLERTPSNIDLDKLEKNLLEIKGVIEVHHIHVWSIDGYSNYATMHIVTDYKNKKIKEEVREKLHKYKIIHVTIELEDAKEDCHEDECKVTREFKRHCNHHHIEHIMK